MRIDGKFGTVRQNKNGTLYKKGNNSWIEHPIFGFMLWKDGYLLGVNEKYGEKQPEKVKRQTEKVRVIAVKIQIFKN